MIITRHDWRLTRVTGSYEENASWLNWPDKWRSIFSGVINQPLTIRFQALVEGTDIPFFTRFKPQARARQQVLTDRRVLASAGYFIKVPLPIIMAPQDELPFRVARFGTVADRWRPRRVTGLRVSAESELGRNVTLFGEAAATSYNKTLCELMDEIQLHLLENDIDQGQTWSLWSREELLAAINGRINRFNQLTGIIQARTTISFAASQPSGSLSEDVMNIRRAVWREGSTRVVLTPIDRHSLNNGFPGWQTETGQPLAYIEEPLLRGEFQLYPIPSGSGTVELVYVARQSVTSTPVCQPLPIPAILSPYIKYGVLADLLMKEGEANDPERAAYCEERFGEGVEASRAIFGLDI